MKLYLLLFYVVLHGFSLNAQCANANDIVFNDGTYYYKSSMDPVNGCISTYNLDYFDQSNRYLKHKLTVVKGELTYIKSWYKSGQLKMKASYSKGVPQTSQCFSESGQFIDCDNLQFSSPFGPWTFLH